MMTDVLGEGDFANGGFFQAVEFHVGSCRSPHFQSSLRGLSQHLSKTASLGIKKKNQDDYNSGEHERSECDCPSQMWSPGRTGDDAPACLILALLPNKYDYS